LPILLKNANIDINNIDNDWNSLQGILQQPVQTLLLYQHRLPIALQASPIFIGIGKRIRVEV